MTEGELASKVFREAVAGDNVDIQREDALAAAADYLRTCAKEEGLALPATFTVVATICGVPIFREDCNSDVDIRFVLRKRLCALQPAPE